MSPTPSPISLAQAIDQTRTGDVWLFRGRTGADRAIRLATNAPVNHVAISVVIDDLPPMMWHAELGKRLLDLWTGTHHRGVQLHDLSAAVHRWAGARGQRVYLRQLHPEVGPAEEDAMLRVIARWNGTSFPSTTSLAWRWLTGRAAHVPFPGRDLPARARDHLDQRDSQLQAEVAYCAELAAITYESLGVLEPTRPTNWYDPGRFWSGDDLPLAPGWSLGDEIAVDVS